MTGQRGPKSHYLFSCEDSRKTGKSARSDSLLRTSSETGKTATTNHARTLLPLSKIRRHINLLRLRLEVYKNVRIFSKYLPSQRRMTDEELDSLMPERQHLHHYSRIFRRQSNHRADWSWNKPSPRRRGRKNNKIRLGRIQRYVRQ